MTSIILFLVLASIVEAQVQNFGQQENENNSGDVRTTAQSGKLAMFKASMTR